ncbi:MAG: hypothetical protein ABSH49_17955 [Bryobacteraceae bacterium]|jgi:hypothetical protein
MNCSRRDLGRLALAALKLIEAVLRLLKSKKYPIPANIEYEYGKPGMDTIAEVRKCFEYCKQCLA